jgi:hypothetical protein
MRPPRDRTRRRSIPRWVALAVGVALIALTVLAISLSGGHRFSGDFAAFAACPLGDPQTDLCLFTQSEGGEFVVGSKTVPISKPITLQGGVHIVKNAERKILEDEFIAPSNAATLSRTPQPVPGGLRGVVDPALLDPAQRKAFDELLAEGNTEVTATFELAAPASAIYIDVQNLIEARGIGLALPMKVKLNNPFLGSSCYIGSNTNPILVSLTTGKLAATRRSPSGHPLAGKPGHAKFQDDYNLVTLKEDSLVSDSFPAPRVDGCGEVDSPQVDPAIDAELGLPAAAGHSTAILNGTLRDANAPAVSG